MSRPSSGVLASLATHVLAMGFLLVAARRAGPVLRVAHMPGTPTGAHMMLFYRLGGPAASRDAVAPIRVPVKVPPPQQAKALPSPAEPAVAAAVPASAKGTGSGGDSALGDENLRIALPQVHPRPQPDLSTLAPGTAGDVIVDIAIDDQGRVTGTTLVRGLGGSVDQTVMTALRGWVFTPANRNGQNVASEQEVLIHYERG